MRGQEDLSHFHAVILAGGRGTRFWPRSRRRQPKQLLAFFDGRSLLWETVSRLEKLISPERIWILTNHVLRRRIVRHVPQVPARQIIAEPVQRNTAPAIALGARLLLEKDPDAIMGVFPSDHYIAKPDRFLRIVQRAARASRKGHLMVFGIPPRWPETGYGYIEYPQGTRPGSAELVPVVRFREKPKRPVAERFVAAGHFYWNSGIFVWRAQTVWDAIDRFLPRTIETLSKIAPLESRRFTKSLREHYSHCDNISIDFGVLERSRNIAGFPCPDFGWNDLGSWEAVYQLLPKDNSANVARSLGLFEEASGNFIDAPGKLVALVGVDDLIVVDTADALLICSRKEAQTVSSLVKALEKTGMKSLL